jgi:hypothetical protein
MKKLIIYAAAVAFIFFVSCSGDSKKNDSSSDSTKTKDSTEKVSSSGEKYKMKSGIITMVSETMGMKQEMIMYFEDHGNRECVETTGEMDMGMAGKVKIHNLSITKDGYVYSLDLTNKTGTKTKVLTSGSHRDIDFNNLTDDMMKQMKITKEGTEVIMGKTCDKYTLNDPTLKMKSSYSVWNGLPLKSEIDMAGIKATVTTTKIEEDASIPAEKFEVPKDIKITEVKGMK